MTDDDTVILKLPAKIADTIDCMAGAAGLTIGAWLSDRIEDAYSARAPSNREIGRSKRRASRRKRRVIALANRTRRAAKAAGTPSHQPEQNLE